MKTVSASSITSQWDWGNGDITISGTNGNDVLIGTSADELLVGGLGLDQLTGGGGCDRFYLQVSSGLDTVRDFNTSQDFVQLSTGLSFSQLNLQQQGSHTAIRLGTSTLMVLENVLKTSLTQSHFLSAGAPLPSS
jgi:uncharacterized protein